MKKSSKKLRKLLAVALSAVTMVSGMTVPSASAATGEDTKTPAEAASTGNAQYRNIVYYGDWSIYAGQHQFYPDKINAADITHLNFAFLDVEKDGSLTLCDSL